MNRDVFEGNWKQLRERARQAWGELTEDELDRVAGSYDRCVGVLQAHYGCTRAEAEAKIAELDRLG